MKPTGHQPPGDVRPRAARFGFGRAVAAAPAMLGSLLLLTLASVAVGRWAGLLLPLAWVAGAAVLMTRVGEQMTLRAACGFHRPSPAQAASLGPAWLSALGVTGTDPGDVELYVQTARAPNAYAVGGRSVAVTSRVVADHTTGRLPGRPAAGRAGARAGPPRHGGDSADAAPDMAHCAVARNVECAGRSGEHPGGPPPPPGTEHRRARWAGGGRVPRPSGGPVDRRGVLVVVGLAAVFVPLANAAISRRAEYAADRFAADHGLAIE
jgi:STE24 endopeptidase